jgi:hypothetical protein
MREIGTLFVSNYLVTSFFLLPLVGLYLGLSFKKVSPGPMMVFHKTLLLLSITLPVVMIMIFHGSELEAPPINQSNFDFPQTLRETDSIDTNRVTPKNIPFDNPAVSRRPVLQDVLFYFVDLVAMCSMLGVLVFTFRYVSQAIRLRQIVQGGRLSKINRNCRLIESAEVASPFSAGYLSINIFIPSGMPAAEKRVVIEHELNHFRLHHHFWSFLETLLASIFWFNPVAHLLRRRGAFLRELACDRRTVLKIDKYAYAQLLIKTAEAIVGSDNNSRILFLTQDWARQRELRKRIETLLGKESRRKKIAIGVLIVVAVAVSVSITLLLGNPGDSTKKALLAAIKQEYRLSVPPAARIEFEKVPPHFINALLVHEDLEFYKHQGVRIKSVFRAAGVNLKAFFSGESLYKDGGSTISQQLAKQFIQNRQKTLKRKFRELKIARVLEMSFSKDEILEMYLNMIYFGNQAFGLKAAAQLYFKHDYSRLTLAESAMLIPFIDAPTEYNLLKDPILAKKRQARLLARIKTAAPAR